MHASMIQPAEGSTPAATAPAAGSPDDRSTEFRAVEGSSEQYSGATLMVEAYAAIWLIMMVWLAFIWRKQVSLAARVEGLEGAIARAERKAVAKTKPKAATAEETTA